MLKGLALAIGNKGNKLALVLALLLGLLAAVLTAVYLSSSGGENSGEGSTIVTVPAVVAAQDIAAGTRITAEMVMVKSIPIDVAIPSVLGKSEDVVGKVAVVAIVSGEQIVASRVVATSDAGQVVEASTAAEVIPLEKPPATCDITSCGQRAVSVAVAPVTSSGGQIRPGDRVDVVLAFQDGGAITIMQDIEVLSIDQDLLKVVTVSPTAAEGEKRLEVSEGEQKPEATTATLAVWPDEAQILTAGEEFTKGQRIELSPLTADALGLPEDADLTCTGSVRLALRHVGQQGPVDLQTRGTCASLFALIWGL